MELEPIIGLCVTILYCAITLMAGWIKFHIITPDSQQHLEEQEPSQLLCHLPNRHNPVEQLPSLHQLQHDEEQRVRLVGPFDADNTRVLQLLQDINLSQLNVNNK